MAAKLSTPDVEDAWLGLRSQASGWVQPCRNADEAGRAPWVAATAHKLGDLSVKTCSSTCWKLCRAVAAPGCLRPAPLSR